MHGFVSFLFKDIIYSTVYTVHGTVKVPNLNIEDNVSRNHIDLENEVNGIICFILVIHMGYKVDLLEVILEDMVEEDIIQVEVGFDPGISVDSNSCMVLSTYPFLIANSSTNHLRNVVPVPKRSVHTLPISISSFANPISDPNFLIF